MMMMIHHQSAPPFCAFLCARFPVYTDTRVVVDWWTWSDRSVIGPTCDANQSCILRVLNQQKEQPETTLERQVPQERKAALRILPRRERCCCFESVIPKETNGFLAWLDRVTKRSPHHWPHLLAVVAIVPGLRVVVVAALVAVRLGQGPPWRLPSLYHPWIVEKEEDCCHLYCWTLASTDFEASKQSLACVEAKRTGDCDEANHGLDDDPQQLRHDDDDDDAAPSLRHLLCPENHRGDSLRWILGGGSSKVFV
jgi:hypothetical protein